MRISDWSSDVCSSDLLVNMAVRVLARALPLRNELAMFFVIMSFVPLAGSLITEPAAMTLAALLLRDGYYRRPGQDGFKYMSSEERRVGKESVSTSSSRWSA